MVRVASSREIVDDGQIADSVTERNSGSYNDYRKEAEKPYRERTRVPGRNNEDSSLRKYHFTAEEKAVMLTEAAATGGVVNPLRGRVGAYWGQVEALIQLGANEYHSLRKIRDKMEEIMSAIPKKKTRGGKTVDTTLWSDFFDKPQRDGASKPKDGNGRIEQNFKVLQRLPRAKETGREEKNPYGLKLAQFGMCIDIEYRQVMDGVDPLPYFRLNTTWQPDELGEIIIPIYLNPNSRRRRRKDAEVIKSTGVMASDEVIEATDKMIGVVAATDGVGMVTLPQENGTTQEIAEVKSSDLDKAQEEWDTSPCRVETEEVNAE